jgi:transposase
MKQLVSAPAQLDSFGALLRARRLRAYLSQEQLAARAELSERTVRNLEADRVRSPRTDTVRLLADALQLSEPERESWFEAAQGVNHHQRPEPAVTGAHGPVRPPTDTAAPRSLNACGFSTGNNHRRARSPAGEYLAEIGELYRRGDASAGEVPGDADAAQTAAPASVGRAGQDAGARNDGGLSSTDRRELAELRRENRRLREDVEILKRVTAIFTAAAR